MTSYTRITVHLTNKIPTHAIINKKQYEFESTDEDDEYYAEDGKWGIFYYTNNVRQPFVQRFEKGTWVSYKPTEKSITIVEDKPTCSTCKEGALGTYGKDNQPLCEKHKKQENICDDCSQKNCDCDYDCFPTGEPYYKYQWRVEEFHPNMKDAEIYLFDSLKEAVAFSADKIVRITKVWNY